MLFASCLTLRAEDQDRRGQERGQQRGQERKQGESAAPRKAEARGDEQRGRGQERRQGESAAPRRDEARRDEQQQRGQERRQGESAAPRRAEQQQRPPERRTFEPRNEQSPAEHQPARNWSDRERPRRDPSSQPGATSAPSRSAETRTYHGGPQVVRTQGGGSVRRDPVGHIREVRTPSGAVITHRPDGVRRVEVVRPGDRVVVVTNRGRAGYVQRPIVYSNHTYVQRTYYVRGVTYTRVYRPAVYRGINFQIYTPVRYYHPAFYTWVWNPWPRPVVYSWGWEASPWYGYYGGYFVPYRAYPGPAFWLTDYIISSMLQEAYEERMEAAAAARAASYRYDNQTQLSPEVKQAISDEVRRQLDQERAQGSASGAGDAPPVFADGASHVFVVSDRLEVTSRSGLGCAISEGDVLQLNAPPPSNLNAADVTVLASKSGNCRKGSVVSVPLQELQDMDNRMRETVDRGLQDLQSRQGQSGIPAMPQSAAGAVDSPLARNLQPETNVAEELSRTQQEAVRGEQDVIGQSRTGGDPVRISLGQSIDDVTATEGQPEKIVDLGAKKIYVYRDLKITFTDGRVTDVE